MSISIETMAISVESEELSDIIIQLQKYQRLSGPVDDLYAHIKSLISTAVAAEVSSRDETIALLSNQISELETELFEAPKAALVTRPIKEGESKAAFENEFEGKIDLREDMDALGSYYTYTTNIAWKAWQAGVSFGASSQVVAEPSKSEDVLEDSEAQWRQLALQFDGHRMAALSQLRGMLQNPDECRPMVEAFLAAAPLSGEEVLAQRIAAMAGVPAHPELTVWYGALPESNGAQNYTAILNRKGVKGLAVLEGFTFARSEYPDRIRYEADCMRYLIGELEEEPDLADYDGNAHSGYVEPETIVRNGPCDSAAQHAISNLRDYHRQGGTFPANAVDVLANYVASHSNHVRANVQGEN